jgi:hypothetical protein
LKDVQRAFKTRYGVILFSHCNRTTKAIEFREGMVAAKDVASRVPNRPKILDLSVCEPSESLVMLIKQHAPQCGVAWTEDEIKPQTWLSYYAFLLFQFTRERRSYFEAAEIARLRFSRTPTIIA